GFPSRATHGGSAPRSPRGWRSTPCGYAVSEWIRSWQGGDLSRRPPAGPESPPPQPHDPDHPRQRSPDGGMERPAVDPAADEVAPGRDADADVVGVGGEHPRRLAVEVGQEEEVRPLEDEEGATRPGVRFHLDLLRLDAKETRRAAARLF